MQKQAAGSLWNVNSWHWQMKNYNQKTKKLLQPLLLELIYQPSKDIKVIHNKVQFTKVDAEINIRKGKPIYVYDLELELSFEVENDGNEEASEGSYKVREIINNSLEDIIVEEVKAKEKHKTATEAKNWIKKNAKIQIAKVIEVLEKEALKFETDPSKLEQDKKKRELNIAATQKAKEQTGQLKEKLLQEQKDKERKLKEQAHLKNIEKLNQGK